MIALPAAQVVAPAPAAAPVTFAPPLDRTLHVLFHEERVQAGVTRRYELERQLVFRRDGASWIAEMTLMRVWQDVGGAAGQRFEAAAGALKGRVVRLHLAADGTVRAIDQEDELWAMTLAGIVGAAGVARADGAAAAAAMTRDPTAALAGLPREQRRTMLAMPLASIIARERRPVPGSGPVTLAGGIVAGRQLSGTRTVTIGGDGLAHVTLHAAITGGADPVALDREQVIDPGSGLVVDMRETQAIGSGDSAQITRQRTTVTSQVR